MRYLLCTSRMIFMTVKIAEEKNNRKFAKLTEI